MQKSCAGSMQMLSSVMAVRAGVMPALENSQPNAREPTSSQARSVRRSVALLRDRAAALLLPAQHKHDSCVL